MLDDNFLERNFMDPAEKSWMWSWIKGNRKWHAWNKCKGCGVHIFRCLHQYIYTFDKYKSILRMLQVK